MVKFKDIQLEDKTIFDSYFEARPYENSEFTFTNLFIWRLSYNFQYAIIHDHLCILGKYRNLYPCAFTPLSIGAPDYEKVLPILADKLRQEGYPLVLKAVTQDKKEEIEASLPGKIIFREDRNNHDYVYLSKDLIELKGNKFRQKRNHINKFLKSYEYQYEEMNDSNLDECINTELKWVSKHNGDISVMEEKRAIWEAFTNFHALKVTGGVIRINGSVQAFTLGELLNPDMAVIHIEKANTEYSGSFNMINHLFVKNAWSDVTYINREEDMGLPGLRKAKQSYNPVKMVKKYIGFYND
ncbi:MAG TPA: DUF2156 domain-containing protein [Clostridiales bacterium]|nr:DUF2156 domain-containing protein [Clostridiales bacterium]